MVVQVFLPLTRLCRDACGYCTFAQPPRPGQRCYMTIREMVDIARAGAELGCTEALFTLGECRLLLPILRLTVLSCVPSQAEPSPGSRSFGAGSQLMRVDPAAEAPVMTVRNVVTLVAYAGDKPELLYPEAAAELRALGHDTTLGYVAEAAATVLHETGLLPHINAGVMGAVDVRSLRRASASQGLMLESTSARLLERGQAHHDCPDKVRSIIRL